MNRVKVDIPTDERHVALLVGLLLERLRSDHGRVPAHDEGLRLSHLRVLDMVPSEGVDVTGLAERAGMTVQGAGQFVTAMVASGHLETRRDPSDGRRKRVHRTERGHDLILRSAVGVRAVESAWASEVGEERYAVFRSVLEELVLE